MKDFDFDVLRRVLVAAASHDNVTEKPGDGRKLYAEEIDAAINQAIEEARSYLE